MNQSTPLQARFADSEAQKRLKQTINQVTPSSANQKAAATSKNPINLCDANSLADSMYLASLQGVHNWTGFGTPQSNGAAAFPVTSPSLGMTSPGLNYSQWSPSMAANAATNWNLLNSDIYGNPLLSANSANYALQYGNLLSPSSMSTSMHSPLSAYTHLSNKSLSPLSFASTPLSGNSPMMGKSDQGSRNGVLRNKATYLPPDVHQQHAKALLEAQGNLAFDSPQAEAFGLSQLLLHNNVMTNEQAQQLSSNEQYPFSSAHSYVNTPQAIQAQIQLASNALGVSNLAHKGDSHTIKATPAKQNSTLSPSEPLQNVATLLSFPSDAVSAKLALEPIGQKQVATNAGTEVLPPSKTPEEKMTMEAMDQSKCKTEITKIPERASTPMPGSAGDKGNVANSGIIQVQDPVTEEGDSLVIDSGTATAVGKFSSQSKAMPTVTLSKSDSAKSLSPKKQEESDQSPLAAAKVQEMMQQD